MGVADNGRIEAEAADIAKPEQRRRDDAGHAALFPTGSITKVLVTTLLMSLARAGLVDLDAPVKR